MMGYRDVRRAGFTCTPLLFGDTAFVPFDLIVTHRPHFAAWNVLDSKISAMTKGRG
jgi:hypothetical protein